MLLTKSVGAQRAFMAAHRTSFEERTTAFEERETAYWAWFAAALVLLLSVDLLTTMAAAAKYGLAGEANPIMRWLLARGPLAATAAHLAVAVLAVWGFSRLLGVARRTPAPYDGYLERGIAAWIGLLLAAGLVVLANNLAVLAVGTSLP